MAENVAATAESNPTASTFTDSGVVVRPMSTHAGAEIEGVDITEPLSDAQRGAIWAALLRWKVVFFRNQPLEHESQMAFARHFGQLTPGHVVFGGGEKYPEIYSIAKNRAANSNRATQAIRPWTGWHTDISAAVNPPMASILRGETVPPYGGDTQWSNLAAAYQALSPTMKTFVNGLRGIHRFGQAGPNVSREYADRVNANTYAAEHPIVRVHPDTGERILFVSPSFLKSVVGLTPRESEQVLEMLWEHAVRPEFTVRFRWEPGSVAFWDNRATCHLAPRDIFDTDFDRQFWRVTLLGDIPKGIDERESEALEGGLIEAVS